MKKLHKRLEEYRPIEVPYHVWTVFGNESKFILVSGDTASLGEDYKTLAELRKAIEWYADQLGGKIKWESK